MNTYGFFAVNRETFNMKYNDQLYYPRHMRNNIITTLRIHNAVLNVLGYIPGVSSVSGCIRMTTGLAILVVTSAIGDRKAQSGVIIERWYDEAILTGISQVARGALEAVIPFGRIVNAVLDVVATPFNVVKESKGLVEDKQESLRPDYRTRRSTPTIVPHEDVNYPSLLQILYLV